MLVVTLLSIPRLHNKPKYELSALYILYHTSIYLSNLFILFSIDLHMCTMNAYIDHEETCTETKHFQCSRGAISE